LGEGLLLSSCVARCVAGIVKESPGSRDPAGALGRLSMLETSTAAIAGRVCGRSPTLGPWIPLSVGGGYRCKHRSPAAPPAGSRRYRDVQRYVGWLSCDIGADLLFSGLRS